jgi:hypothetical protein
MKQDEVIGRTVAEVNAAEVTSSSKGEHPEEEVEAESSRAVKTAVLRHCVRVK